MIWFLTKPERAALRRIVKMLGLRPGGMALSLLFGVAGLGSAIALAAVSAWLIARASQMPPVLYLSVAATSVRMFGVLRAVFRYVQRLASHRVALDGMDSLRLEIYDSLTTGPIDRVAAIQRGDLLSRIGADIDAVGDYIVKSLLPFLVAAIVGVGTVIGFAFLSIPAAIILAIGLIISGVVAPLLMTKSARAAEKEEQAARTQLAVTTLGLLESADELSVSGRLAATYRRLRHTSKALDRARGLAARPAAFATALDRFAMGGVVVGVILVAVPETNAGLVAAVALAVLVLTPLTAFEGTAELGAAAVQMIRSARAAERISDLLGPEDAKVEPSHDIPVADEPHLSAKDLTVGWPGRTPALQGVNLDLSPGHVVAVVGPSGIGKSTLLYTLAGMLDPRGGSAELNGSPVWGGDRDQVTHAVTLTTEDAHIFATTVVENLRVARADLTDAEAAELLDEVGLGSWLASLPNGLDTLIGAGATSISGGERRRLLLARALASPARLLLLDEPGEHLDAETADAVMQSLFEGGGRGRGLVVVTHRLSGLEKADRVIILEPSDDPHLPALVGASGTHSELLETNPEYRWAAQQEKS
ncbi:thiol reductant ABC exporter subunit CydC [Actinomyces minihominis]|uniref:thiol reductant ABC exporter subunit CydC n=1 Tax=Actinomyces minihominis TaxID=2002838 RepID=UPI000C083031|nr:thiol reductant ABC exporter subunit CydC [Actinomyces minihominis]